MTDQQTTTEQRVAEEPQSPEEPATPATPTPTADATQPTGTRELRDAQQGNARATAEAPARPSINATDGGADIQPSPDAPLFDEGAGSQLRERWLVIQTEFVDEPRTAVQKADALVAEVLKQLTDTFAREREALEAGWSGAPGAVDGTQREVSTEDLRQAIQRYRSFFNRLLAL